VEVEAVVLGDGLEPGEDTSEQASAPSPAPGGARCAARQPSSSPISLPVRRRQPPSAVASGIATASRSASGSFAITNSAPPRGRRERQVHRPRLLRVREGDRREAPVGLDLLLDDDRQRVAGESRIA
jgi:hypothetical protein